MEDWEQLANKTKAELMPSDVNKWDGEDEDDDVKDNWEDDDEEEEKKDQEKAEVQATVAPKVKPKTKLQDKIAEKERLEAERLEEERLANMTPEEKMAEKLRLQKLQEEGDLKMALDTFGVSADQNSSGEGIDGMVPTSKAEFSELAEMISRKVGTFKNKDEFPTFVEDLVRGISIQLSSLDLKRIKTTVDNLYIEKQKLEKEKTKKPKKTNKPKLRMGQNAIDDELGGYNDYDVDDFM